MKRTYVEFTQHPQDGVTSIELKAECKIEEDSIVLLFDGDSEPPRLTRSDAQALRDFLNDVISELP